MTDTQLTLSVGKRETGKTARRSTEENQVRGVIYGKEVESTPVISDYNATYKIFQAAGTNGIVEMQVEGGEKHEVMFKEIDFHPVTNRLRHIDFYAIRRGEKLTVEVPVVLIGEAPAEKGGLHVSVFMEAVEVTTIPNKIPSQLEVDALKLVEVGDTLTVADITNLDPAVEVHAEAEAAIAKVEEVVEMVVEDENPVEMPTEEGEEAEGEAAEGATPAEGAAEEKSDS